MSPVLRKANLVAHVVTSVGWLGAVVSFLVLSVIGANSHDAATVRGSYLAMNLIGQLVIVPLSIASLATGVVQSLGTPWGLLRHYWVLAKLVLTVFATILLLLHQFMAVAEAARRVAGASASSLPNAGRLGTQLVVDAGFAAIILLATTVLSVFKPWGRTRYSLRREARAAGGEMTVVAGTSLGYRVLVVTIALALAAIVALHLTGHGMGHHGM
jgi:hypothetical protein